MSVKRKTPPGNEDVLPTAPSSTSTTGDSRPASYNGEASRPASYNGDASRPASYNGDASLPASFNGDALSPRIATDTMVPRRPSSVTSASAAAAAAPPSASSGSTPGSGSGTGPAPSAPASTLHGGHGAKHRRTGSVSNSASNVHGETPNGAQRLPGTPRPVQPAPPSLVVPEAMHARFQHPAFPHMINLVPASLRPAPMPGQPPGSTGSTSGTPGPKSMSAHGSTPKPPAPASTPSAGSGSPVVVGQVLHPAAAHGGLAAPMHPHPPSGKTSSPLNRAAVLAAAERSGVKALNGLPCINALWHVGTYTWGAAIPIHGIMDGYSCRLLALRAGESSHPKIVATLFRDTVKAIGCYPARLRAEETESLAWVKERMRVSRGKRAGWFIHGPPESNQHLAPIWSMISSHPAIYALEAALEKHTADGILDKSCPLDLLAIQVAYLPQLNAALDQIRKEWNKTPVEGCPLSKDNVWAWNIQEWSKRGRYPATEPESVELPREAVGQHAAEEFVNYGATGGPFLPCSVYTNRPSSENGEGEARKPIIRTIGAHLLLNFQPTRPIPAGAFAQAPLDDIGDIDACLRLWLEDFPLPKARGYAGVRAAMGEFIADEFAHVATRFRVGRDRAGK